LLEELSLLPDKGLVAVLLSGCGLAELHCRVM